MLKKSDSHIFVFQIPIDQLNRASRLLLGALLEAHDMLEQMHTDQGSVPHVEQSVKENIERVRRLSTEITLSEEARNNLSREKEEQEKSEEEDKNGQEKKKKEEPAPEAWSTNPISEETHNELPTPEPVCLPSTEADCAVKASVSDQSTTTRCSMPDVVADLSITPTKNDLTNIPDVLHTAVTRRRVPPRKSPGTKPTRRRIFRLNTLQELQASKKASRPQPLTWTEAGAKLAEVARSWRSNKAAISTAANPGRHQDRDASATSRRMNREEGNWDGGTAKVFVTGVVKIVSCVSLYLIVRKMESLLK